MRGRLQQSWALAALLAFGLACARSCAQEIHEPAPAEVAEAAEETVPGRTVLGKVNVGGELSIEGVRLLLTLGTGEHLTEFLRLDGTFTFRDVPPGLHILEVFHLGFVFPQTRLEVSDTELDQHVRASYVGSSNQLLPYPLMVQPMGKVNYFEPRQKFSLRSFIFQPQIMMMIFMIGGLVLLPKMAIDPEQMKELQKEMSSMQGGGSGSQGTRVPQQVKHRRD